MKREIVLMCCAFLFLGAGILLFVASGDADSTRVEAGEARDDRAPPSEESTREKMVGFFRVVEDLETGALAVFFPPNRQIASFPPPVQVEVAGLWGLASGAFFAQQPASAGGDPARCQLFRVRDGLSIQTFSWNGRCRLPQALDSALFWLDYAPFGARVQVSLPLRVDDEAPEVLRVDWQAAGALGHLTAQRADFRRAAQAHCSAGGDLDRDCQAALRALALLSWSEGHPPAAAALAEGLPDEARAFVEEISEEMRLELGDLLHQ